MWTELDNPVWFALSELHREFGIDHHHIKFYEPDYCPFGAFTTSRDVCPFIESYSTKCHNFYIVGEKPDIPSSLQLKRRLVCDQMLIERDIKLELSEQIVSLGENESTELFNLVNLVQPGYFQLKTHLLGKYYGIYKDDMLVAVTGERMKMASYTEVSAVVTHPEYTGRGFAKQLVAHAVNEILGENKIPFLHVAENNLMAINLYKKLRFNKRRKMNFWNIDHLT